MLEESKKATGLVREDPAAVDKALLDLSGLTHAEWEDMARQKAEVRLPPLPIAWAIGRSRL